MADLPKIVAQRLDEKATAAGIHPDPNLISAFAENSLPRDARASVMQHLAQCADCREVVFLSSLDQSATLLAVASAPSTWLSWPVLRWGAAVAAVVVVAAAVSLHRPSGGKSAPSGARQMTDAPIAKEKAAPAALLDEKREIAAVATPAPAPAVGTDGALVAAEDKGAAQLKKQGSRMAASPMPAQQAEGAAGKVANERKDEIDKTTTVEVTAAAVTPQEAIGEDRIQVVPGKAKDTAAEPVSRMSGGVGSGVASNALEAPQPRAAVLPPVIAPRWTLTSDGTLQRSLDFGRTWQTIPVASQANFRALAAGGKDIWVGGSKGALYHSTDAGQNWTQVQPIAAGVALNDDIIGVEFPDVLHGKLTTSNKETWTTEDGGQSWNKQ
jgi:photosynthesis system II assembly factor YCF48-like protein/putative zinc finger protein